MFYKNFNKTDNVEYINEELVPSLQILLNKVDWSWLSNGLPEDFTEIFILKIFYTQNKIKLYIFRLALGFQNLSTGDIYYDLAKINHGLIVNHNIIVNNRYSASWENNKIDYKIERRKIFGRM